MPDRVKTDEFEAYADTALWDKLVAKLGEVIASKAHAKVGVLSDKGSQQVVAGEGEEASSFTVVELAAVHEFGSEDGSIKERSFIRSTMRREQDEFRYLCADLVTKFVNSEDYPIDNVLGILGAKAAAEIKSTIRDELTEGPEDQANAESTIAEKGSSTPLVDTGQLINAITWAVVFGDESEEG